jgi:DNA-binding transcriptional regulator YiaG
LIGLQEKMMFKPAFIMLTPEEMAEDPPDALIGDLTSGERLWLWRHRAKLTRGATAAFLVVPKGTIQALERGTGGTDAALPRYVTGLRPTPPEALRIARRRSSLGSREVATRLGVSRMALWKWERAGDERLAAFWDGYNVGNTP